MVLIGDALTASLIPLGMWKNLDLAVLFFVRACAAGSGFVYGIRLSVFSKKIGEYSCCVGHYLLFVIFVY